MVVECKSNQYFQQNEYDSNPLFRGILGYGGIGRQVARVSKALGMQVYAYTLSPRLSRESKKDAAYVPPGIGDPEGEFPDKWFSGSSRSELHEFLSSDLDLLVISLPMTNSTRHLISKSEFEVMSKKKTFVINVSRGAVIHTDDIIEALNSGKIRGAALDVTDPEPLPDGHPLWSAKNVVITPHVSGETAKYTDRVLDLLLQNLKRLSMGEVLMNVVDQEKGY